MTGDEYKDKLLLYRNIEQQYKIEQYTNASLIQIQKALDVARKQLFLDIADLSGDFVSRANEFEVLEELNILTFGIQAQLQNDIVEASVVAGKYSFTEYDKTLSFDGALADTIGFNFSAVSPDQIRSMVISTPVGGKLLESWVKDTFELRISDEIKTAIMADTFQGLSTDKVIDHMSEAFGLIKNDAETLVRTYIASINNQAAEAVYKANSDIVKYETWNATLEVGLSGKSTCLRCASLDSRRFKVDEPHIRPPLHHRCRCFMLPETLTYKELGLDIEELKTSLRPYSERAEKRKILDAGQFEGDFEKFLFSRDEKYQKDLLGPNRYRLIKDGKLKFGDLVDENGNIRLLKKDKDGNYTGLL